MHTRNARARPCTGLWLHKAPARRPHAHAPTRLHDGLAAWEERGVALHVVREVRQQVRDVGDRGSAGPPASAHMHTRTHVYVSQVLTLTGRGVRQHTACCAHCCRCSCTHCCCCSRTRHHAAAAGHPTCTPAAPRKPRQCLRARHVVCGHLVATRTHTCAHARTRTQTARAGALENHAKGCATARHTCAELQHVRQPRF